MRKIKLVCRATKTTKEIEVEDLFDSINPAKEMVRDAVEKGIKDPKVYIYVEFSHNAYQTFYDSVAWSVITKKDIVEKIYQSAELTDYELETLKMLVNSYEEVGIENSDYWNVFGYGDRKRRGAISSLIKKQVIDSNICPDCFNPIFPVHNFISTCKKYGIGYPEEVKDYCKE